MSWAHITGAPMCYIKLKECLSLKGQKLLSENIEYFSPLQKVMAPFKQMLGKKLNILTWNDKFQDNVSDSKSIYKNLIMFVKFEAIISINS